jgi:hypothetical protein
MNCSVVRAAKVVAIGCRVEASEAALWVAEVGSRDFSFAAANDSAKEMLGGSDV